MAEKKQRAKKDPNAPKKNLSAYMLFAQDKRAALKEKNPNFTPTEMMKLLGAEWAKASDSVKKDYEAKAAEEKKKYVKAVEAYKKTDSYAQFQASAPSSSGKKKTDGPKRPMSAYMFYSTEQRSKVKENNPDASFGDVARLISANWKKLSAQDKAVYEKKAGEAKKQYETSKAEYDSKPKSQVKPAKKAKTEAQPLVKSKPIASSETESESGSEENDSEEEESTAESTAESTESDSE